MGSEKKFTSSKEERRRMFFISVVICVMLTRTSFTWADVAEKGGENNGCTAVKVAWGSKGFNTSHVHSSSTTGEHLKVCTQGFTCCSAQMETKLTVLSRQDFNRTLSTKIGEIRQAFAAYTTKYDAFCTGLIDKASRDLHEMFLKTYGMIYQQNSKIFLDLFKNLKQYYEGSNANLEDVLDRFFQTLMQHMFKLLNANYEFDDRYLQCVTEHMDQLKPFGDVPKKLSTQVKRAFIGARTFHQGLVIGREAVTAVSKLDVSQSCLKAMTKMTWCAYCRGFTHLKPCHNYCLNVVKGCVANHYEMNESWITYIDWLSKVGERLEGPFNIESVVDPIDVKISDAIMNFQENNDEVSKKVFLGCGQPTLAAHRKKRSDDDMNFELKHRVRQGQQSRPATAAGTNIDQLMREFREKIPSFKDLWRGLARTVCNSTAAPAQDDIQCWNGLNRNRYIQPVVNDGLASQQSNPEVDVDVTKPSAVVSQQILQLRMITEKLKRAFNGQDVDYYDVRDSDESIESSGSGDNFDHSGSGDEVVPRGDISFTTSVRPSVKIQTIGPYVSSIPNFSKKVPPRPRVTAPTSAAQKLYRLPWRAVSTVVLIMIVLKLV